MGTSGSEGTQERLSIERAPTRVDDDLVCEPKGRPVLEILVAVDLLLLEGPVRQRRFDVSPHRDSSRDMNQLEVARLGHPLLAGVRLVDLQLKLDVALADLALLLVRAGTVPRREFRVGRHGRTGDVVRHQGRVGPDVAERDHVAVADDAPSSGRRDLAGRLDDPVVVGVIERVAGDLLTGRRDAAVIVLERVALRVRVQESLGPLVLDRQRVVIADLCGTLTRQPRDLESRTGRATHPRPERSTGYPAESAGTPDS